ncbi:MAG: VOC family protein [Bacteroidota bacterium]
MLLEHVAINVPDPVAMAKWYVTHCDMRLVVENDSPPFVHFLADQTGRTCIEIYNNPMAPVPDYSTQHHLIYHQAFAVENMEQSKADLLSAGASFVEEVVTPNGSRLIMLRDPWGIPLQLVHRIGRWY